MELKNVIKVEDPTGFAYYLGTLTPRDIKQLTFVPVVVPNSTSEDPSLRLNERPDGYQRAGDSGRMDKIRDFVLRRSSCLIPPVLLSCRGKWKFKPSSSLKTIGTIEVEDLAAIIDGQHRLGGLWRVAVSADADESIKDRPIPFMAVEQMDTHMEKVEFVDINDNQKGVKKSLLRYLDRTDTFGGIASTALMEDEESVFSGRIDIQKKYDWTLFLFGAAQECVALMFSKEFTSTRKFNPDLDKTIREQAIEFVLKYWKIVSDTMSEFWVDIDKMPPVGASKSKDRPGSSKFEYRLLEETGIRAFSKLAAELFTATWMDAVKSPAWEVVTRHLTVLAESDTVRLVLTKPRSNPEVLKLDPDLRSSGKAGVDAIYRHLHSELMTAIVKS